MEMTGKEIGMYFPEEFFFPFSPLFHFPLLH
jgi:hypothetical protein